MKWLFLVLLVSCAHNSSKKIFAQYQHVLDANPVREVLKSCVTIDLKSQPMAWYFRESIRSHNRDLSKPNFNGQFYLLESPMSGGSNWFVADCKTGKVKGTDLIGDVLFSVNSSVLVVNPPEEYPEIYKWINSEMVLQKNKIHPPNV